MSQRCSLAFLSGMLFWCKSNCPEIQSVCHDAAGWRLSILLFMPSGREDDELQRLEAANKDLQRVILPIESTLLCATGDARVWRLVRCLAF